ncbi:unnamed protein product [Lupinus luteus]|uniref:Uncharacterized protein n=1 Tax=Lupinus luteus TaxID=3873 RepID=A0AAV1WG99_LUPLU
MSIKNHKTKVPMILNFILVLVCVTTPIKAIQTRKLDETKVSSTTTGDEKCTPCGTPNLSPPPPPPPPLIYLSTPPPLPKKPPSHYCPPPPSSYIFITGPPGPNLYPVVQNFNGASHGYYGSFYIFLPLLVGLFSLLTFW